MIPKKILLFAPAAFNLAETTRMIEIAKGILAHETARELFEIQFISDGGDFEQLIEEQGFALHRMIIPANVIVTDWLPALEVNKMTDLSLIHGGIGTVMSAAYAGRPVVGVGMQMEQVANLACLVRKSFAIRVAKSKDPSRYVQEAIGLLLRDKRAKSRAAAFAKVMEKWDGPRAAADLLAQRFG